MPGPLNPDGRILRGTGGLFLLLCAVFARGQGCRADVFAHIWERRSSWHPDRARLVCNIAGTGQRIFVRAKKIIFDGTSLKDIIGQLERTCELRFGATDSALLSRRLKAPFKRERSGKVSGLIAFSLEIGYELREEDTVMLKTNPKRSTQ